MYKRLKLLNNWHDAQLVEVLVERDDVTLLAHLSPVCNGGNSLQGRLTFHGVKYIEEIRARFAIALDTVTARVNGDVAGVFRQDSTHYVVDVTSLGDSSLDGGVVFNCRGMSEV